MPSLHRHRLSLFLAALFLIEPAVFAQDTAVPAGVTPAADLAKLWKRKKSLAKPQPRVRKGLTVQTGADGGTEAGADDSSGASTRGVQQTEVTVDGDTGASFPNIQFALDSDQLAGPVSRAQIAEIAKAMQMAGTERFLIEGHTCDLGDEAHNLGLSFRRALTVRATLIALGVPRERLQVMGFGETDPPVDNVSEAQRAQNRRVQVFRKLGE